MSKLKVIELKFAFYLFSQVPELEEICKKPLIEILSTNEKDKSDEIEEGNVLEAVSKILPKVDKENEQKKDLFKNFDKIESEFDTLD